MKHFLLFTLICSLTQAAGVKTKVNPHVKRELSWVQGYTYTMPVTLRVPNEMGQATFQAEAGRHSDWQPAAIGSLLAIGVAGFTTIGAALNREFAGSIIRLGVLAGGLVGFGAGTLVHRLTSSPWVSMTEKDIPKHEVVLKRKHAAFIKDVLRRGPRLLNSPKVLAFPKELIVVVEDFVSQKVIGTFEILEGRHRGETVERDFDDTRKVRGCLKTLKEVVGTN